MIKCSAGKSDLRKAFLTKGINPRDVASAGKLHSFWLSRIPQIFPSPGNFWHSFYTRLGAWATQASRSIHILWDSRKEKKNAVGEDAPQLALVNTRHNLGSVTALWDGPYRSPISSLTILPHVFSRSVFFVPARLHLPYPGTHRDGTVTDASNEFWSDQRICAKIYISKDCSFLILISSRWGEEVHGEDKKRLYFKLVD
jgi:hypothetical protein